MADRLALYFGCIACAGHYLWVPGGSRGYLDPKEAEPTIPWTIRLMDGGLLKNRKAPEARWPEHPDGRVHWTAGGKDAFWHAFFWWDRSVDRRPGSNSGFYVRGFARDDVEAAFAYACETWPTVVQRQVRSLQLVLSTSAS